MRCIPEESPFLGLAQLDLRLLNALQCSDGHIPFRMRNRHAALLGRMLELLVAADLVDFEPAIPLLGP